jgi:hypothetical protein
MSRIQRVVDSKEDAINSETALQREHLKKRMSEGTRLDQALEELDKERRRRIKRVEDEYRPGLRVYEKRLLLYKDLLSEKSAS